MCRESSSLDASQLAFQHKQSCERSTISLCFEGFLQVMQPGFLHKQLPTEAPQHGEKWDVIMKDMEDKIVPGALHRQL
jgi:hypothetical protein